MRSIKAPSLLLLIMLSVLADSRPVNAMSTVFNLDVASKMRINYDPFSGSAGSDTLLITLKRPRRQSGSDSEQSRKGFKLRIRPTSVGDELAAINKNGQSLPVRLRSTGNSGRVERFNNEYTVNFAVNDQSRRNQRFEFSLRIPPSIFADADQYFLPLDIDVLELGSEEPVAPTRTVTLEVLVKPKLQTSLAGTRSSFGKGTKFSVVDFDVLETNESKRIFLQVRGNTRARIKVSSENHGRLRHTTEDNSFINYSVNVDGRRSTLSSPLELKRSVARNFRGSNYPIVIKIGDVSGAYAGAYKDIISIDVEPQ